jgi:hypothetical protein
MTLVSDVHTNSDESVNNNQLGSNYSYADLGGQCRSASLASTQKQLQHRRTGGVGRDGIQSTDCNTPWFFQKSVRRNNESHRRIQDGRERAHETKYGFSYDAWLGSTTSMKSTCGSL